MLLNYIFKVCINLKKLTIGVRYDKNSSDDIATGLELITEAPLNLEEIIGCGLRYDTEQLFVILIEKSYSTLKILDFVNKFGLNSIKGMTSLRVLHLNFQWLNDSDMSVIESLPNLTEITGLYPSDQSN